MAPSPSATLGSLYCTINGEEMEITGVGKATIELDTDEYCIVKDTGKYYPSYKAFIRQHCWHREDDWVEDEAPIKDRVYKIIESAPHDMYTSKTIYVIEDMDTEQIYMIGEDGIVKVTEPINYTWGLTDITSNDCATISYDTYVNGKFPTIKKGEIEMRNEVLELYAKREKEKIVERFKKIKEEEYNNLEAVNRYNELIGNFKASVAELVDEYKNEEPKIFVETVYENHFGYEINPYLERQISEKFREDYEAEVKELDERIEEIKAVLSLSNDIEYQKNVLVEYGILNKKGVMVNE